MIAFISSDYNYTLMSIADDIVINISGCPPVGFLIVIEFGII